MRGSNVPRRGAELKELNIISDGSLLIEDGVIVEVGPTRRVENLATARNAVEVNAVGRVVMPGFVDCHTHLMFPPPGTPETDREDVARSIRTGTGQRLRLRTQGYLESMARHGTTTVEAKTGCGHDESTETKLMRVMAALKNDPLHVVPTYLFRMPETGGPADHASTMEWLAGEFLPKVHRRRFARYADLAWDDGADRQPFFVEYLEAARKLGFRSKIHAEKCDASAAIAMAIRQFAVAIEHLEHATAEDARMLAGIGTIATLLPCPSFCNGGRNAPARAFIDAGVAVALASDFNPWHTPTVSMQTVVALACLRLQMTPAEAISAATINSACALDRAERVGSLDVGKDADLLILNTSDHRDLAQNFGMNLVRQTMRRGEFIYTEGDVSTRATQDSSLNEAWD
jgi:imidazolonepropionase